MWQRPSRRKMPAARSPPRDQAMSRKGNSYGWRMELMEPSVRVATADTPAAWAGSPRRSPALAALLLQREGAERGTPPLLGRRVVDGLEERLRPPLRVRE